MHLLVFNTFYASNYAWNVEHTKQRTFNLMNISLILVSNG